MIESFFALEQTGEVIIEKHWGSVTDRSICEYYLAEVERHGGGRQEARALCWARVGRSPVFQIPSVITTPTKYVFHVERGDVALLCTTGVEVPPLLVTEFLVRCADLFGEYFESCSAGALRAHFVTVYQLLEEMVDSGMPTCTEANILKEMIPPPSVLGRLSSALGGGGGAIAAAVLPGTAGASAVPWRRADCRYSNNEIFFDVVEALDATLDAEGRLLAGGIYGEVHATTRLSGMPDLTLTFANAGLLDDVRFHPCVRYARFAADRVLSFVPPDGPCKLLSYRIREPPVAPGAGGQMGAVPPLPLPLYVKPQFSFSDASGRISVMVGARMDLAKPVEGVTVRVPLPACVASIDVQANVGGVGYDEKAKVILWDLGTIPRDRTPILSGVLQLDRARGAAPGERAAGWDEALSLELSWKAFGTNVSGLAVDALHLANEQYKLYKGVRYTTMSGRFVVRV